MTLTFCLISMLLKKLSMIVYKYTVHFLHNKVVKGECFTLKNYLFGSLGLVLDTIHSDVNFTKTSCEMQMKVQE